MADTSPPPAAADVVVNEHPKSAETPPAIVKLSASECKKKKKKKKKHAVAPQQVPSKEAYVHQDTNVLLLHTFGHIYTFENKEIALSEVNFATTIGTEKYDCKKQFPLSNPTLLRCSIFAVMLSFDSVKYLRENCPDVFGTYNSLCITLKHKATFLIVQQTCIEGKKVPNGENKSLVNRLVQRYEEFKHIMPVEFILLESKPEEFYKDCDDTPWEDKKEQNKEPKPGEDPSKVVDETMAAIRARQAIVANLKQIGVKKPFRQSKASKSKVLKKKGILHKAGYIDPEDKQLVPVPAPDFHAEAAKKQERQKKKHEEELEEQPLFKYTLDDAKRITEMLGKNKNDDKFGLIPENNNDAGAHGEHIHAQNTIDDMLYASNVAAEDIFK